MKFYAVAKGRKIGIFTTWEETKKQVDGFSGAKYKSFSSLEEAKKYLETYVELKLEFHIEETKTQKTQQKQEKQQDSLEIYTDGSCVGKNGGYGYVYLKQKNEKYKGRVPGEATNQIAELYAIWKALENTDVKKIRLYTDSDYSIKSCTVWSKNWIKNGWKNSKGQDVSNQDLIKKILKILEDKDVEFIHVYGHTGNFYNEMCDRLANEGRMGI